MTRIDYPGGRTLEWLMFGIVAREQTRQLPRIQLATMACIGGLLWASTCVAQAAQPNDIPPTTSRILILPAERINVSTQRAKHVETAVHTIVRRHLTLVSPARDVLRRRIEREPACTMEASCVQAIGKEFKARFLVKLRLGRLGQEFAIYLEVLDIDHPSRSSSRQETLSVTHLEKRATLEQRLTPMLAEVLPGWRRRARDTSLPSTAAQTDKSTSTAQLSLAAQGRPQPSRTVFERWWFWGLVAVGIAAAVIIPVTLSSLDSSPPTLVFKPAEQQ